VATLQPGKESAYYGESEPFEVVAADVTDVEIKGQRAATLSGSFALEGTDDTAIRAMLPQLQLYMLVRREGRWGSPRPIELSVNPDGTFHSGGVPGGNARVFLRYSSTDYEKFTILRVERDGVEQIPWLKIKDGEQISGVRVVVGYGTGGLRGTVKLENGDLSPTSHVYAQLFRETVPGGPPFKYAEVDGHGRFIFESVPPGSYQLLVEIYNPAVSGPQASVKQNVVISDRLVSEVTVSIDLKTGSAPKP
jgi:hypothetical protein